MTGFAYIVIAALIALLNGFLWMVALGALSHIFNVPNLAIGYWSSVLVAFIGNIVIAKIAGRG